MVMNLNLVKKERCKAIAGTTKMQCLHYAKIDGYCLIHWEKRRENEQRNNL